MKRILILSASYAPVMGGVQTAAARVARGLLNRGHEVCVVTARYPRHLPAHEVVDGIPVERFDFLMPSPAYLRRGRLDLFLASFVLAPLTLLCLLALARNFRPDVLHLHFPDAQIPYALVLKRFTSARLVVSLHGDEVERYEDPLRRDVSGLGKLRRILSRADAVTTCSAYLLEEAVKLIPEIREKTRVIHNGVDLECFSRAEAPEAEPPYVFAFGRLVLKKGFDLLLAAWARISPEYPRVLLRLAGEGPEENSLRDLAAKLGIGTRVEFLGRREPSEIAALIRKCLFVVIPSRKEPFGMAALEAAAAGKPVLATRTGGMGEFLDPSTNLLVNAESDAIADGLRSWLAEPEALPKPPRLSPQDWGWEAVTARYEAVLTGGASW